MSIQAQTVLSISMYLTCMGLVISHLSVGNLLMPVLAGIAAFFTGLWAVNCILALVAA